MGLDQYLRAKIYFSDYSGNKKRHAVVRKMFPEIKNTGNINSMEVVFEAGYWRKANHIHKWFVDNVQRGEDDCKPYNVSREKLKELKKLCQEVINNKKNAEKSLPRHSGFFFGNEEYGDDYFSDVKETIKIIDYTLSLPEEWAFEYQASW